MTSINFAKSTKPYDLQYIINVIEYSELLKLEVELIIHSANTEVITIILPSLWSDMAVPTLKFQNIFLLSNNLLIRQGDTQTEIKITHTPNEIIHLNYILEFDSSFFGLWFAPNYICFVGYPVFMFPDWDDDHAVVVDIFWKGIPAEWHANSSFGQGAQLKFDTVLYKIRHAIYLVGKFSVSNLLSFSRENIALVHTLTDDIKIKSLIEFLESALTLQFQFWQEAALKNFSIVLLPYNIVAGKYTVGTQVTNVLLVVCQSDFELDNNVKLTLLHELIHFWNGQTIRLEQPEEINYWFSEGFTEYYARLSLLWLDQLSLQDYILEYNDVLKVYYSSPYHELSNQELANICDEQADTRYLFYLRGEILANNMNYYIMTATNETKNLDDFMLHLLCVVRMENRLVNCELIYSLLEDIIKQKASYEVFESLQVGSSIKPEPLTFECCYKLEWIEVNDHSSCAKPIIPQYISNYNNSYSASNCNLCAKTLRIKDRCKGQFTSLS